MRVLMARSTWGIDRGAWPSLFTLAKARGHGKSYHPSSLWHTTEATKEAIEFNLHRAGDDLSAVRKMLVERDLRVIVQSVIVYVLCWNSFLVLTPQDLLVVDQLCRSKARWADSLGPP